MARNGLDQIASMTPFVINHSDQFKSLWGGFPPGRPAPLRELAKERLEQAKPLGIWHTSFFPYVNGWWKVKDEENVLLLHYTDAKNDLPGTVSKMANFYGVNLTEKEHANVVEKCSYNHMKKHEHMFEYSLPLNPDYEGTIMKSGKFIGKGENGVGKVYFTDEGM